MTKPAVTDSANSNPDSFVQCVQFAVDGNLAELGACLDADPSLVHARSAAPFGAPLLHYAAAANGVEDEYQRTPPNAAQIVSLLLDRGAEPDALSNSYGGGPNATALCLLVSSWHPFAAGVQDDLARLLVERGASLNGLEDDGMPLATALVFGYSSVARTLAQCGARVDNLVFAAALGDMARVASFFGGPEGKELVAPETAIGTFVSPTEGKRQISAPQMVQEAFHFAVGHGHLEAAEYLLERGASVDGTSIGQHCELPLHQTIFVKKWDAARWLIERGADLDAVDGRRRATARAMADGHLG